MVALILAFLALFVIQTLLPGICRYVLNGNAGAKLLIAMGPRDEVPPQSKVGARAERALGNTQEATPVFLALALLNLMIGTEPAPVAVLGAQIFVVARLAYVPAYLLGMFLVRSLIWVAGLVGLCMMAAPLLARI